MLKEMGPQATSSMKLILEKLVLHVALGRVLAGLETSKFFRQGAFEQKHRADGLIDGTAFQVPQQFVASQPSELAHIVSLSNQTEEQAHPKGTEHAESDNHSTFQVPMEVTWNEEV